MEQPKSSTIFPVMSEDYMEKAFREYMGEHPDPNGEQEISATINGWQRLGETNPVYRGVFETVARAIVESCKKEFNPTEQQIKDMKFRCWKAVAFTALWIERATELALEERNDSNPH